MLVIYVGGFDVRYLQNNRFDSQKICGLLLSLILVTWFGGSGETRSSQDGAMESEQKPLVIGHRGAAGLAPENTLAAFARSIELEVDAVELDVHLSMDGELIVYHDPVLKPEITRGPDGKWLTVYDPLPIKSLTVNQLKTYDVGRLKPKTAYGNRYPDQKPADGERIPTLREVIGFLKQKAAPEVALWIEIKTSPETPELTASPDTIAEAVVDVVRSEDFVIRTKILSFDWRSLVRIQEIAPGIQTVFLSSKYKPIKRFDKSTTLLWSAGFDPKDYDNSLPEMIQAAGGRHWGAKYSQLTNAQIRKAHAAGVEVYAWTVDSKRDMIHLIQKGVDGIITNRPDILQSVLK